MKFKFLSVLMLVGMSFTTQAQQVTVSPLPQEITWGIQLHAFRGGGCRRGRSACAESQSAAGKRSCRQYRDW